MKIVHYIADLIYGASRYPCGWLKPFVVVGNFGNSKHTTHQKMFFDLLLRDGFKRTFWQIIFPGQIAGLIKKTSSKRSHGKGNEYHVRFYNDGTIECELEVDRWGSKHWTGPRNYDSEFLNEVLENPGCSLLEEDKSRIKKLFGSKGYSVECERRRSNICNI